MTDFALSGDAIRDHLDALATRDTHVRAAVALVGYPDVRPRGHGFPTLLRVIVGQQLSVKAAATIAGRVEALVGEDICPAAVQTVSDEDLRAAGLSWQKISYVRSLCDTVAAGTLDVDALPAMDDEAVVKAITAVKGLGVWSAHMYMMFSLGRSDVWPVGDLGVRAGVGHMLGLKDRPDEKETETLGARWRPYRSVMAMMAWHYMANAPL